MAGSLVQAFALGNAAILTNVCLLPLYPGVVAYLLSLRQPPAGEGGRAGAALIGAAVLAGVLVAMVSVGVVFTLLKTSVTTVLPVLLPVIYLVVTVLGVLLLLGRNPLSRLPTVAGGLPKRPRLAAFTYGLLLGPMTLPCTGPVVTSAFVLGLGSPGFVAEGLAFFAAFGLGFGWPLLVIPVLSASANRRFSGWLTRNHATMARLSGALLVGIGLFGLIVEVLPNIV